MRIDSLALLTALRAVDCHPTEQMAGVRITDGALAVRTVGSGNTVLAEATIDVDADVADSPEYAIDLATLKRLTTLCNIVEIHADEDCFAVVSDDDHCYTSARSAESLDLTTIDVDAEVEIDDAHQVHRFVSAFEPDRVAFRVEDDALWMRPRSRTGPIPTAPAVQLPSGLVAMPSVSRDVDVVVIACRFIDRVIDALPSSRQSSGCRMLLASDRPMSIVWSSDRISTHHAIAPVIPGGDE